MLKRKHMSMLNIIFPLHIKTKNYHLKYPDLLRKINVFNVNKFSLKKTLVLMNNIILAICIHDSLKPPNI